jgi:16S rRNA (guanine527-N7)-methyltransferase
MRQPDAQLLAAGAAALGVALSDEKSAQLLAYLALLSKWNRVYNLTAVRDPSQMLVQHLLDSMAVIAPLRRHTGGKPARVLDVGSGAGLPGVVIAALMPELDVICVDAVGKKAAFVRQATGELALKNLHVVHSRVEDMAGEPFDVIVSRAFASLADFVALTWRHRRKGSVWVAMKARLADEEAAALPPEVEMFHVEHLTVPGLDAERCLIWMRDKP